MSTSSNSPVEEDEEKQKGKEIIGVSVAGSDDDRKDDGEDQAAAGGATVDSSSRDPQNELFLGEEGREDGECFKTPTSSDHKIPALTQCPPAPIKPRPAKFLKRKASPPSGLCRSLQYDSSSAEVESIFRSSDQKENAEEQEKKRPKNSDGDA